ncbi:MAG: MmcQ/YjbR family DNA-binding protein [Gammaproteobacteria bacterium]|nr:MmcQ/YjbR family DNA-binding protein [Gammaproteobacteria bacterium]
MDYKSAKHYLLSKPETIEDYPFGPAVAVFKIKQKMFATLARNNDNAQMNLKCDPYKAAALRDVYAAVLPGYHMNKLHWNTILLDDSIPDNEIRDMIDHSYTLVVKGLKKVEKQALLLAYGKEQIYCDEY